MKKIDPICIGVWLELGIGAPFSHEGLARLLFFISEGFPEQGVSFMLTAPSWMKDEIEKALLELAPADRKKFNIFIPRKKPIISLSFLNNFYKKKQKKENFFIRFIKSLNIQNLKNKALSFLVTRDSFIELFFVITISLFVLPILIIFISLYKFKELAKNTIAIKLNYLIIYLKKFQSNVYEISLRTEFDRMAAVANKNKLIDCWFILNPFSVLSAHKLSAPIVSLVADFVPFACPSGFSPVSIEKHKKNFYALNNKVKKYITISEHVKKDQLIEYFRVSEERIKTITHGIVSINKDLEFDFQIDKEKTNETRRKAAETIKYFLSSRNYYSISNNYLDDVWYRYLKNFPFDNVRFILISTQNRPYKNTLLVVKALDYLIKNRGYNFKIIMTGVMTEEIQNYIIDNDLYFDVISIPRVPNKILAALYHCAFVAVHASFFEGGVGAFPFYEAISVGTPVILSRNAATLELSENEIYRNFLFDPYSLEQLVDRLEFLIENEKTVYEWQCRLYASISKRTWRDASLEYLQVFQNSMKRENCV